MLSVIHDSLPIAKKAPAVSEITYRVGVAGAVGYLFGRAVEVANPTFIAKLFVINEIARNLSLLTAQSAFGVSRSTSKKLSVIHLVCDTILIGLMHKHQLINQVSLVALSAIAVLRFATHSNVVSSIGRMINNMIESFHEDDEERVISQSASSVRSASYNEDRYPSPSTSYSAPRSTRRVPTYVVDEQDDF
jgi:hypothetical protein